MKYRKLYPAAVELLDAAASGNACAIQRSRLPFGHRF